MSRVFKINAFIFLKPRVFLLLMALCFGVLAVMPGRADWTQDGSGLNRNSAHQAVTPYLAYAPDGTLYAAWLETNATTYQLYVSKWTGSSWSSVGGSLNHNPAWQAGGPNVGNNIILAIAPNGTLYAAWDEQNLTDYKVRMCVSTWYGGNWVGVGTDVANTSHPGLAVAPDGTLYDAYISNSGTALYVYVNRWSGSSWVNLGGGISHDANVGFMQGSPALTVAPNGTLYCGWVECAPPLYPTNAYVSHWSGTGWVSDGGALNASGTQTLRINLAVGSNSLLFAGWAEGFFPSATAHVSHWTGGNWVTNSGSGVGGSYAPMLAVAPNNTLYAATFDGALIYEKHWNGSDWIADGNNINATSAYGGYYSIAIAPNNVPYVAYSENGLIQVKHFVPTGATPTPTPVPPRIKSMVPRSGLISSQLQLSVLGKDLLGTSAIKLQNSKTNQTVFGSSLDVSSNSLSAQFSLPSTAGLFDLVLTNAGLNYIYKTSFTLLTPHSGQTQWQMTKLSKAGNPSSTGSLVIADADRDNEAEVYAASGDHVVSKLKKKLPTKPGQLKLS